MDRSADWSGRHLFGLIAKTILLFEMLKMKKAQGVE